jgi:toxin ParE1/3/4
MKVRFSVDANSDLEAIGTYIARENPSRAMSFVQELACAAISVGDAPFAFPELTSSGSQALRRKVHDSYLIIYRVSEREVEIVRIFHGAQDLTRLLDGGGA